MRCQLLFVFFLFVNATLVGQTHNILDFGAKPDGRTPNTSAIQAAINRCAEKGGKVIIPHGTFLSGTLYLKSNVHIHLSKGAVLLGSDQFKDYPDNSVNKQSSFGAGSTYKAFIFGQDINNISITGEGTIHGNGQAKEFQLGNDASSKLSALRPTLILMVNCRNILVENVHLKNSAYWMQNYLACENLHIKGINVYNHCNYNNDAIDVDSKNVLIEDCTIDSDDDGICLKSHYRERFCENVVVRNCSVKSNCNAVKFGTASLGGFRNIKVDNITISKASEDNIRQWQKQLKFIEIPTTVISGIAIENVDGGHTENISISNIEMKDVQTPIFIKLGNRGGKEPGETESPKPGRLRNVTISNITATSHSKISSSITGFPGYNVENVKLSNVLVSSMGQGTEEESKVNPPENEKGYPENRMFGEVLPASGLFIRHAKGIILENTYFEVRTKDFRRRVIFEDVKDYQFQQGSSEYSEKKVSNN